MNTQTEPGLAQVKQMARATWAMGDFAEVAKRSLWEVGDRVVRRIGVGVGDDVLDIACGTGNAALRAAQAGGRVVASDLTPELFVPGRALAAEAGVEIDWVEADAEDLPFADESFDIVLSTFGIMFAPRHRVATQQLVRVLRPGGRFALACWTPDGLQGTFFKTMGQYAPPPPPFVEPPLLWGDEDHVRELFDGSGVIVEFARESVPLPEYATPEESVDWGAANFGPLMRLRAMLEEQGRWAEARATMAALYVNGAPCEYLVVTGRKP